MKALAALLLAAAAVAAFAGPSGPSGSAGPAGPAPASPGLGLAPLAPAAPGEALRAELGRQLFFDRRQSFNGTMSCAMCHVPEEGFASNASRQAVGIEGRSLKRNAPTVLNVAWLTTLFHDGRENALAPQAWSPLLHPDEMANPSVGYVLDRLRRMPDYAGRFERAFAGRGITMDTVGEALAAYQRTLIAGDSRFDRWRWGGQTQALSAQERQGWALFTGKAACVRCHTVGDKHALFTDQTFHVTGAGAARVPRAAVVVPLAPGVQTTLQVADRKDYEAVDAPDYGRWEITQDPRDRFAFRTPTLRNVARTAPYMHDGSLPTLEAVIDFYVAGGGAAPDRSPLLRPLPLDAAEKQALVAFLRALDSAALPALVQQARRERAPMPR